MNREIKFRAKCKDNGDWVYGSYIANYNNNDWIVQGGDFFAVDSNTVGQFTGHIDMEGKEIYEDDVLYDVSRNLKYIVYYGYGRNSFVLVCFKSNVQSRVMSRECCDIKLFFRVCGNRYDNPELLVNN